MAFWGMSNQYDFICNGVVVYKGTQFTEYEKVEEDKPETKNFSELWAKVEAAIPLFVLGCLTAYVEDNGFTPPSYESNWDSNWFCFGRAVGHAVSLAQATYEITQGFGLIGAGLGGGVLLALPSGGTAVAGGAVVVTVGAAEVTHGSLVFGNAVKNTFDDSMYFSKRGGGTSGTDGGGSKGNSGGGKNVKNDSATKESSKDGNTLPVSESKLKHIFRDAEGHLPDTPTNRKLLQETTKNSKNYLGRDKYGNDWHGGIREDGTQVWVQSRNGEIWDGGLNKQARHWNDQTGLKNQDVPKR